jgi:membrane protein YqaA with SNARE-associated domain
MIDLVLIAVGILSIAGAVTGWYLGRDMDKYSSITKITRRDFDN